MRAGKALTVLVLVLLAGVWGLCFTLGPHEEPVAIQVVALGSEDGESTPVLQPGEVADSSLSFKNQGRTGCKLRVRVCGAAVDGEPVLEAGYLDGETFVETGSLQEEGEAYWAFKGAYLYYKNSRTDDQLPPGRETPPLYTAVRLNAQIDPDALTALRDISPEQQLYVLAQVQPGGEGPWQEAIPRREGAYVNYLYMLWGYVAAAVVGSGGLAGIFAWRRRKK